MSRARGVCARFVRARGVAARSTVPLRSVFKQSRNNAVERAAAAVCVRAKRKRARHARASLRRARGVR
eukprot:11179817-Lingulodinium_polyedra.AAC.1